MSSNMPDIDDSNINLQEMMIGLDLKSKHEYIEKFLENHKSDICLKSLQTKVQSKSFVLDYQRKVNLPFLLKLFQLDEQSQFKNIKKHDLGKIDRRFKTEWIELFLQTQPSLFKYLTPKIKISEEDYFYQNAYKYFQNEFKDECPMSEDMLSAFYIIPSRQHIINIISTDQQITKIFKNQYNKIMTKIRDTNLKINLEDYRDIIDEVNNKNKIIDERWSDINDKPNIKRKRTTNYIFKSLTNNSIVEKYKNHSINADTNHVENQDTDKLTNQSKEIFQKIKNNQLKNLIFDYHDIVNNNNIEKIIDKLKLRQILEENDDQCKIINIIICEFQNNLLNLNDKDKCKTIFINKLTLLELDVDYNVFN